MSLLKFPKEELYEQLIVTLLYECIAASGTPQWREVTRIATRFLSQRWLMGLLNGISETILKHTGNSISITEDECKSIIRQYIRQRGLIQ